MLCLPLLLMPALLQFTEAAAPGVTFYHRRSWHAAIPLKTNPAASKIQCAAWCEHTSGCIQHDFNTTTGACTLWGNPSIDNAMTTFLESVYEDTKRPIPAGFQPFDSKVSFFMPVSTSSGDVPSIAARCRETWDTRAIPAVPLTLDELLFLGRFSGHPFIGAADVDTEGTYVNIVTGESVNLPNEFWEHGVAKWNTEDKDCVTVHIHGKAELMAEECLKAKPVICEIRI